MDNNGTIEVNNNDVIDNLLAKITRLNLENAQYQAAVGKLQAENKQLQQQVVETPKEVEEEAKA
ncbi:hypothetical protein [Leuconostoc fallax]|uniref:hypothetical protein n=1 Tax=Leuconostoc fallax TaxID=1251 RepID=UPI001C1EDD3B|nr:hypothetical protein [Leuconostoc fallax]MBU7455835.1 hypothetical protein [Leuconostoc fallax]